MFRWWRRRRATHLMDRAMRSATRADFPQAIREATAAIILLPCEAVFYQQRGRFYHLNDQHSLAVNDYTQAISLSPEDADLYRERGLAQADEGNHAAALADYDTALRLNPHDAATHQGRGRSNLAQDDVEAAIADFSTAIKHDPDNATNYHLRAELYAVQGKLRAALEDYDAVLERLEAKITRFGEAVPGLRELGMDAEAASMQAVVDGLQGERVAVLVQRGTARQLLGDLPGARVDLDAALALDPQNAAAFNARGKVRYQQDDPQDALEDFQQTLALEPLRYATYLNLAEVYFKLNRYAEARAAFEKLDGQQPENVIAQMGLALCDHALGKRKDGKNRWRLLVAHDESFGDVKWLKETMFPNHPLLLREAGNLVVRL